MDQQLTIVLPRFEPDLDGVACAVAYSELLQKKGIHSKPCYSGEPDSEAQFRINSLQTISFASIAEAERAVSFILVDASEAAGIPAFIDFSKIIEVIDHRFIGDPKLIFPNAIIDLHPIGAAATAILERFRKHNILPSEESALYLYSAIFSNTQCLKNSLTLERDIAAAKWLETTFDFSFEIIEDQFLARKADIVGDIKYHVFRESKDFELLGRHLKYSQLEFLDAIDYAKSNLKHLAAIQSPRSLHVISFIDVSKGKSFFIFNSLELLELSNRLIQGEIIDNTIYSDRIVLRKQLLRHFFELNEQAI